MFNISCLSNNSYLYCSLVNNTNLCRCECYDGFITVNSDTICNYEQLHNSINIAFSIMFGLLGSNWFYLARENITYILLGFIKFMCLCIGMSSYIILLQITQTINDNIFLDMSAIRFFCYDVFISITTFCMCFIVPLWYITDIVCSLLSMYPDGNGYELY